MEGTVAWAREELATPSCKDKGLDVARLGDGESEVVGFATGGEEVGGVVVVRATETPFVDSTAGSVRGRFSGGATIGAACGRAGRLNR